MPMTLCGYRLAAKRATMAYLEKTLGQGWWGSESYSDYYEQLEGEDNPCNWIKVIPTMSTAAQNATGYDRAGKYECSILMSLYPDCVTVYLSSNQKRAGFFETLLFLCAGGDSLR